jgi:hypothetical protein
MRVSARMALVLLPLSLGGARTHGQSRSAAVDIQGTWQLQSSKNLKTGAVTRYDDRTFWLQFTKSHWMLTSMVNDRPKFRDADLAKLSAEDLMKKQYSLVWNGKGEQIVAARGGTYTVTGKVVHAKRLFALIHSSVGNTDVLTIDRLNNNSLVYTIPPGVQGADGAEITARRID